MSFTKGAVCAVAACLAGFSAGAESAGAEEAGRIVAGEGEWVLKTTDRPSGGGVACILAPKSPSRIQIVGDRLEVTGLPRKSIFNYRYRIDDEPVSQVMFPTARMQEVGAVSLDGDVLERIVKGKRFSIRLLDRWHEAITEDIDLAGLRSLREKSADTCR